MVSVPPGALDLIWGTRCGFPVETASGLKLRGQEEVARQRWGERRRKGKAFQGEGTACMKSYRQRKEGTSVDPRRLDHSEVGCGGTGWGQALNPTQEGCAGAVSVTTSSPPISPSSGRIHRPQPWAVEWQVCIFTSE